MKDLTIADYELISEILSMPDEIDLGGEEE